eukprot:TRINITY_DN388_c0_g1_i13.p1 TRINITY_DN388_c0_g1~~TRINITY_DN388_c0_g1_i13.p1  ORF type:complete len:315 (+),score=76.39 TRINITY_DN388_c0_g1_i13:140-946(+)
MMSIRMSLLVVLLCSINVNAYVTIRAVGSASSENVVEVGEAVAKAVAKIETACEKGQNIELVADAQAIKVVEAAAEAYALGGIFILSESVNGSGKASVSASAESTATAIAKGIASAIADIADTAGVSVDTTSITSASKSVAAAIKQEAEVSGTGFAIAAAAATAKAFVSAVADAMAQAAAKCNGATGTVDAKVSSGAAQVGTFADFTSTYTASVADISGDGFAFVSNEAVASATGGSLPATEPASPSMLTPAVSFIPGIFCNFLQTFC